MSILGEIGGVLNSAMKIALAPTDRSAAYSANRYWCEPHIFGQGFQSGFSAMIRCPLLPGIAEAISIHHAGVSTYDQLRQLFTSHGIVKDDEWFTRLIEM